MQTMPSTRQAMKAIRMFKDEYLLDYNPLQECNQAYVEYAVRDYNKPMGVATYKTFSDMPKEMQRTLLDIEELKRLMNEDD